MAVSPGMTLFKLASLRTVWVNAEIPEMQAELAKPGVPVQARVAAIPEKVFKGQIALLVPTEAVISTGTRNVVIVADDQGKFHPVDVARGRESGDMTEIRKGVQKGQRVVVSGQFLIDSESSLKATLSR